jgi:hypothetical protein
MFRKSIVTGVLTLGVAAFSFTSCEEVADALSQGDTVAALKEALSVGVNVAVDRLSTEGYAKDIATKIGLPEEAQAAFTAYNALQSACSSNPLLKSTVGTALNSIGLGDNLESNMIQLFNDAATEAAPEAASVFASAITNMSVQDGEAILFGGSGAATTYLKDNTYTGLQGAFHDPIVNSMNNVNIAGMTATSAWTKFATGNNKLAEFIDNYRSSINLASSVIPSNAMTAINSVGTVDTDISNYVTGKALDGLFLRVSQKEDDIRTNAAARTSDLLKRVFGRLDE